MEELFSTSWKTSGREYDVVHEETVFPLPDGVKLAADIFKPKAKVQDEKFPVILSVHPYNQLGQFMPIFPKSHSSAVLKRSDEEKGRGSLEAGDPRFYARRGYVHVIASLRGTGKSEGFYQGWINEREVQDSCDLIEYISRQPWCDGKLGMFGVSYFAMIQWLIASKNPSHLKCIFAPWALTDQYRDLWYRGGILNYNYIINWWKKEVPNIRYKALVEEQLGREKIAELAGKLLSDEELSAIPEIADALRHPDGNGFAMDILLNQFDGAFWDRKRPRYDQIKVPCYMGADWANFGLHLPGAFRSWQALNTPKKMIIGPPAYLDRPLYQLQYESLRWFDYWLKGMDTKIMEEPPIRLFMPGRNEWRPSVDWPIPETQWTPFYLHERGLLWEHEFWPNEGSDSFFDSPWERGHIEYETPQFVENTEIIGPIVLNLHASSTDSEVLWIVSLFKVDSDGQRRLLTKGWLRGSQRRVDPQRSKAWEPFHPHTKREPLEPNAIHEFNIPIRPTACILTTGTRLALQIKSADDAPNHPLEALATGSVRRQTPARITVYHDEAHPSHILLPVISGNIVGTFVSGGKPYI